MILKKQNSSRWGEHQPLSKPRLKTERPEFMTALSFLLLQMLHYLTNFVLTAFNCGQYVIFCKRWCRFLAHSRPSHFFTK